MTHSNFRLKKPRGNERAIFFKYCLFAYGVPIAFVLLLAAMDETSIFDISLKCSMGVDHCWIRMERTVQLVYLYLPVGLVLSLAVAIYAITARTIYRQQHENCRISIQECWTQQNIDECRVRFFLYFRLFIVMFISWTLEIILWSLSQTVFENMSEIVNCLHILIIISLFKWKPKIDQLHSAANR